MTARHTIAEVVLWLGVALAMISCLGVLAMRSAYDRLHFTSPAILGAALVAISVVVQDSFSLIGNWALVAAALLLLGSPILTHASGRVARIQQHGDWLLTDQEAAELEVEER